VFDGVPEFYARRRRNERLRFGAAAFLLVAAVAALMGFRRVGPFGDETVISAPSHLRQVEVFSGPGEMVFYLHNAGYRLPHKLQLIGIVYGAEGFSVKWQGPDGLSILLHPGWSRLVAGHPKGVAVAFARAP